MAKKKSDYDYTSAYMAKMFGVDLYDKKSKHWGSRVPNTPTTDAIGLGGRILKSQDHNTFDKTIAGEKAANHYLASDKNRNLISIPGPSESNKKVNKTMAMQDPAERVAKKIGETYDYSKLLRPKAEQLAEHQRGPRQKPKEPVMGPPAPPKPKLKPKPSNPYARETAAQSEQSTRAYDQEVSFVKEQKARKARLAPKLGITQSAPSSRQQQKSAQTKREAAAVAKRQDALKTGTVNRKKKTFGASATRGVTPGDQSTPDRGDRR